MEKRRKNKIKKAQVSIITIVLIILIIIVAVVILWNVINPLIREKSQQIDVNHFSINLEISSVKLFANGVVWVSVKRNAGGGDINNLKFIFYDKNGTSASANELGIKELEAKTYEFSSFSGLGKISKIAVAPVINGKLGMSSEINTGNSIEIPSGVVEWWKSDNKGSFNKYYSDENLVFGNQMALSFWVNKSGEVKTNSCLIKIENKKINFSYSGVSVESENDVVDGWNYVAVSIDINGVSKIYLNNEAQLISYPSIVFERNLIPSGNVDDVILFNKALSEKEVEGFFNNQKK